VEIVIFSSDDSSTVWLFSEGGETTSILHLILV